MGVKSKKFLPGSTYTGVGAASSFFLDFFDFTLNLGCIYKISVRPQIRQELGFLDELVSGAPKTPKWG